jgi:hypothetical protein
MPYSFLRASQTSAANSRPLSMMISVGHGYISGEPGKFQPVDDFSGSFDFNFCDLKPSGCRIDHGEGMKRGFILTLANLVRTYEVDT